MLLDPFNLLGMWSSPIVSGTSPPPCADFSLTMIDDFHSLLFAGYQGRGVYSNDVFILDVAAMVSCLFLTTIVCALDILIN